MAQIITGILEYVNGNTFGTVAFTSYGLFWCWWASMKLMVAAHLIPSPPESAVGAILLLWGVFTFYLWISTFKSNKAIWSVFLLLTVTFFLLGLGDFGWHAGHRLGGWTGLLTGIIALYVSFAEVANATFGRELLPLGHPFVR